MIEIKNNSVSSSLVVNLEKITVSNSKKKGKQLELVDIIAIVEWLESKNKNGSLFQTLRAIAFLIKRVEGMENLLDGIVREFPDDIKDSFFSSDTEYLSIISSVVDDTENVYNFLEEAKSLIKTKERVDIKHKLISILEYANLKDRVDEKIVETSPILNEPKVEKIEVDVKYTEGKAEHLINYLRKKYNDKKEDF